MLLFYVRHGDPDYETDSLTPLGQQQADAVVARMERIRPDMVIHRLTGDGAKRDLIAPLWSGDKKAVLNALRRYLAEHGTEQGRLYEGER